MLKNLLVLVFLLSLGLALAACGGGEEDDEGFNARDGAVLFGGNCVSALCHAADGTGLADPSAAGIAAALANQPAMAQLRGMFSDADLSAISSFLTSGGHSSGWRQEHNHGGYAKSRGVATCEVCHGGPALTGDGAANSCFQCHGRKWN